MIRFVSSPKVVIGVMLGLALLPVSLFARRQPLVMAHGIRSSESTWSVTGPALFSEFPVSIVAKSTGWTQSPFAQATSLIASAFPGLPDSTLAIGHSMGGLVLKQAALDGAHIRGLATVGTLHQGAAAADNVRKGFMPLIFAPLSLSLSAIAYAWAHPDQTDEVEVFTVEDVRVGGAILTQMVSAALLINEFDPAYDNWDYMYPSSSYIQSRLSAASLAEQKARIPIRASIRTKINEPWQALWRSAVSQPGADLSIAVRDEVAFTALFASLYLASKYCWNGWSSECNNSSLFADFFTRAIGLDYYYCDKLQRENAFATIEDGCEESDGVMLFRNQRWGPAEVSQSEPPYSTIYDVIGPSHSEQTKAPLVRDQFGRFLLEQASVARCGSGPTFSVSLGDLGSPLAIGSVASLQMAALDRCLTPTGAAGPVSSATSSDAQVVSVVATGASDVTVQGHAVGSATITVQRDGLAASRTVYVAPSGSFLSVQIDAPPPGSLQLGETATLSAVTSSSAPILSYAWRVENGPIVGSAATYYHQFWGNALVSVEVTNASGQTATSSAYLTGSGGPLSASVLRGGANGKVP